LFESEGKKLNKCILLDVPDQKILERLTGRWIHMKSGRSYHTKFKPPRVAFKDDVYFQKLKLGHWRRFGVKRR
jgi:adenylate kinase